MTEKKTKILYAEDDAGLAFVTKDNLELSGYEIKHSVNGHEAFEFFKEEKFDLCILDVMMPVVDGFTVAKKIRKMNQQVPILFLTAKSLEEDKLNGLQIGGDDYITKPFSIEELKLKIEIFLKRKNVLIDEEAPITFNIGTYVFDYDNLYLKNEGSSQGIYLTQREADVLKLLCDEMEFVVKKKDILVKLWGEADYYVGRSLDVFISRLRKYLKEDPLIKIDNLHGVGFRLTDKPEEMTVE